MPRTRPVTSPARPGSTRTTGLLVAVGVGLAAAGLVGYVALMKPRPEDAPRGTPRAPLPADLAAIAKGTDPASGDQVAQGVRIELADKKDPTRIATILTARSVTPKEGRIADVTEPGAIVFLQDGRALRIRAATGTFSSFSADQAPERGTFKGAVRADLYAAGVSPRTTEWDRLTPVASADFGDAFDFDLTFGRILIPGAFTVRGDGLEIRGTDATLVLDEAAAALRSATIARDFAISRIADAKAPAKDDGHAAPGTPTPLSSGAEALYRVTMSNAVSVLTGTENNRRTLDSDRAFAFVRLVNNRLRPGAIARIQNTPSPAEISPDAKTPPATLASADEPFSLRTSGPVEIKLAADAPPELAANDLAIRLEGTSQPVRFADADAKASGTCPVVEYVATKGDLTLIGSQTDSVSLKTTNNSSLSSQWLTLNVPTKIGQMRGPGSLGDIQKSAQSESVGRSIAWTDQTDFGLAPTGKRSSWEIAWAQLAGKVTGGDDKGTIAADTVKVQFAPGSQPTRATLIGGASACDGRTRVLTASSIDLTFRTLGTGKTEPSFLTAKGLVEARDLERLLTADLLEAAIARTAKAPSPGTKERPADDAEKRTTLAATDVTAKGSVNYVEGANNDRIVASADELRANVQTQRVDLIGNDASISQGGASVFGQPIRLDGLAKTLKVDGEGRFEMVANESDEPAVDNLKPQTKGPRAAKASWGGSMSFDDKTGVLEAKGGARASSLTDEFTMDTLSADRLVIQTERKAPPASKLPASKLPATNPPADTADPAVPLRKFVGERVLASITAKGVENSPAKVESRRYETPISLDTAPGTTTARVSRLHYLEGATIIASSLDGTLSVPSKGRSLVLDRTAAASERPLSATDPSFRGTALFEWTDSMMFTREFGVLNLKGSGGGVKITSDNTRDDSVVFIQSDAANATLTGLADLLKDEKDAGKAGDPPARAQLSKAEAIGNVFGRFKAKGSERELNAHRAFYDATAGLLTINAKDGGEVSLFDTATATPVRAAELRWDLANDRVEIVKPSPITTPR